MKKSFKKKQGKKMSLTVLTSICVLATAAIVAVFGFLSSGFSSTNLTVAPEGAPTINLADAVTYDGWQVTYGSWDSEGMPSSYSGLRVKYAVDPEIVEKYEEQGYKVEYGVIFGVGTDKESNTVYNTVSKLAVKVVEGSLVSATEEANVYLAYSSDETVETDDIIRDVEGSTLVNLAVHKDFGGNIDVAEDGDHSLDTKTYVSVAFIRLTDSMGKTQVEYIPAREVLQISPFELGEYK